MLCTKLLKALDLWVAFRPLSVPFSSGYPPPARLDLFRRKKHVIMHQSIPAVSIPPGISGEFFLIVRPGGRALAYPGAFDGPAIFMSQHCHFLLVISSSDKGNKFVINFV